ncbi:MAG TPA: Yip1 family protein [bacterium]
MADTDSQKEKGMDVLSRIVGVFASPKETFTDLDRRPTWLLPFIILVVAVIAMQLLIHDISIQDNLARIEASGRLTQEQLDARQAQLSGPASYIGLVFSPIGILFVWCVMAGLLLFGGNTILGGSSTFKKMLALVSWSSLIGIISMVINIILILSEGTSQGVTISPAYFLPAAPLGEAPPVLYRFLSKFDPFTIWQMVLWTIGVSVMYKFTVKKSALFVGTLWVLWILLSVALGGLFYKIGM